MNKARRRAEFEKWRLGYAVPDCFGKTFLHGQRTYTVWGIKSPRAQKAVVVRADNGKQYLVGVGALLEAFLPTPDPRRRAMA